MVIRTNPTVLRTPVRQVSGTVQAAAQSPVSPALPAKSEAPALPDPTKAKALADLVMHPIKSVKAVFDWGKNILSFDRLGVITPTNAPQAQATLGAADSALGSLAKLFPFMFRAVDRRAAQAVTQLRPGIEQGLSARSLHGINIVWPVGGANLTALQELTAFDRAFANAPDAAVQKALSGISEINVQRLSLWDMANPVKRQAATLVIQRPITWLPGQKSVEESVRAYLEAQGTVKVTI
ncbi:hypothetical protein D3C86_1173890 [compost metagenome]